LATVFVPYPNRSDLFLAHSQAFKEAINTITREPENGTDTPVDEPLDHEGQLMFLPWRILLIAR
jgi:hypothetical protein